MYTVPDGDSTLRRLKAPWSCTVSLRFNAQTANERPSTHFFAKTENKSEVEQILRRAQLAILNPGQNIENFVDLDIENYTANPELPILGGYDCCGCYWGPCDYHIH